MLRNLVLIALLIGPSLASWSYPRQSMKSGTPVELGIELNHSTAENTLPSAGHPKCDAYFWVYFWDSKPNNQNCADWKKKPGKWYFGKWYCFTGVEGVDKMPTKILFTNIENAASNAKIFKARSSSAELWVGGTVGGPFGDGEKWTRAGECAKGASQLKNGEDTILCSMDKLRLARKNPLPYKLYYITPDECSGVKPEYPNQRLGFSTQPSIAMKSGAPVELGLELNHSTAENSLPSSGHPKCDAYFWVYFWDSKPNNQNCADWKNKPGKWYFGKWYCFTGVEGVDKMPTRILFTNIENAASNAKIFKARSSSAELWVGGTVGGPFGDGEKWARAGECAKGASQLQNGEDTILCSMDKLRLARKNPLPYKLYYITPDECSGVKPEYPNQRLGFSTQPSVAMKSGAPVELGLELNHSTAENSLPSSGHPKCDAYFWVYFWDSKPNNQNCADWKNKPGKWYFGKWYCFTGVEGVDKMPTKILFTNIENAASNAKIFKARSPSAELWVGGTVGGPFGDGEKWARAGECAKGASQLKNGEDTILCSMQKLRLALKNPLPYKLYYITPDECSGVKPEYPNQRLGFSTQPSVITNSNIIAAYGAIGVMAFGGMIAYWMTKQNRKESGYYEYESLLTLDHEDRL